MKQTLWLLLEAWQIVLAVTDECSGFDACNNQTITDNVIFCESAKSCDNSIFKNVIEMNCGGDSTCTNSKNISVIYSGSPSNALVSCVFCAAFNTCANSNIYAQQCLYFHGSNSGNGSAISFATTPGVFATQGLYSFANGTIKSRDSSIEVNTGPKKITTNTKSVVISASGSFDMYNGNIISNGNDLLIYLYGYYSGYGLTVDCSEQQDKCIIYCAGNSCVNLTLNCYYTSYVNSNPFYYQGECYAECLDEDDELCQYSLDSSNIDYNKFDDIAFRINNLISNISNNNYSIMPGDIYENSKHVDYYSDTDSVCDLKMFNPSSHDGYSFTLIDGINDTFCFLGMSSFYRSTVSESSSSGADTQHVRDSSCNVYCNGYQSCITSTFGLTSKTCDIYARGYDTMSGSSISYANMISCEAELACERTTISHSRLLLCLGDLSCTQNQISNTGIIIATGTLALEQSTITCNNSVIYLLGYQAGKFLEILFNPDSGNFGLDNLGCVIYCQNNGCKGMNTSSKLYCDEISDSSNSIRGGTKICSFFSQSPTMSPTDAPSTSPTDALSADGLKESLESLLLFLQHLSVTLAIVLISIAVVMIGVSYIMRKRKLKAEADYRDRGSTILEFVDKYGYATSDFVIGLICFEIYDLFTDIAYLIELKSYQYNVMFGIFISSMGVTIIFNTIIVIYFFKNEFLNINGEFKQWYDKRSGSVLLLTCLFVLTDVSGVTTAFTSQIFGLSLFYSPMSVEGVNMVQIVSLISIFVEHIPQLLTQFYVIFYESKYFSAITMCALIVGCIDIIFGTIKAILRIVRWKHNTNGSTNSGLSNDATQHLLKL